MSVFSRFFAAAQLRMTWGERVVDVRANFLERLMWFDDDVFIVLSLE